LEAQMGVGKTEAALAAAASMASRLGPGGVFFRSGSQSLRPDIQKRCLYRHIRAGARNGQCKLG